MELAKILVNDTTGVCIYRKRIPAGIVGATVSVEFRDPIWDRLSKTVVFRGSDTKPAKFDGRNAVIPWEVVQEPGQRVFFGIWGSDPKSDLQLPLIEVDIGSTEIATDPNADPGTDPTLPIWAQLQEEVEKLKQGGVSDEQITAAVNAALQQAKDSGEFDGKDGYTPQKGIDYFDGDDYVLTPADKAEIAEMAAELVEVPDSGGNVDQVTVEPAEDDIPKVFITGVKPTTKDDVLAEMEYISKTERFHAYLEIKCQGSSSMSYAKKNFTVKLYSDETRETKQKKVFKDWNHESNKFVLKANWIDHSHARNVVSARLWGEVVESRPDYDSLPVEMRNAPNNGAIDGFPVKLYYNGTYEGLYTWNIGKDAWMWGMDEDNPNHSLLSCCYNDNGVLLEKAGNFRALWSGTDEDNWAIEVGSASTALTNSLNALISCVKDTDDETFKATIGTYLDINSALDYYLYFWANAGLDSLENNMLLATYDGVKWICGAYDMDSVWGLHYTGESFIAVDFKCPDQYQGPYSLLWERITALFIPELQARYAELRSGVLSYSNIVTHFERFMDVIGSELYAEDLTIYTGIPSGSTNNIKQIRNCVRDRLAYVDAEVSNMSDEPDPTVVPCTGISLNTNTLTFTGDGSQTLTAIVTPDGCTDVVTWESNDTSIATVSGGVVTAVGNGSATITAKCGDYSAICSVSVSGISDGWENDTISVQMTSGIAVTPEGKVAEFDGAWANENAIAVSSDYVYTLTPVDGRTEVTVSGYDESGNYVEYALRKKNNFNSITFIVSQRVKNVVISVYNTGNESVVTLTREADVSQFTIYSPGCSFGNGYLFAVHATYKAMPRYFEVESGASYTANMGDSATYPGAHAYDANYAYLSEITGAVSGGSVTFITPDNAKYIRLACLGNPDSYATIVKNESRILKENSD